MLDIFKDCMWKNFGGCMEMLANAIAMYPEDNWSSNKKFFYGAYHTLVFLDYYLSIPPKNFSAPLPFTLIEYNNIPEDAIDDVMPDSMYSKKELLGYVAFCREKCRKLIAGLTEEQLKTSWIQGAENADLALSGQEALSYSVLEIFFYNMRHVQHHTAQLNLLLRQQIHNAPEYISHTKDELQ
ncbi:MAG: hypothetical protein QM802_17365 [Agriterribacter sp.]